MLLAGRSHQEGHTLGLTRGALLWLLPSLSPAGCWYPCAPAFSGGLSVTPRTVPTHSHSLCSFYFNQEVIKSIYSLKTVEKVSKKAHGPSGVGMEGGPGEHRTWHPERGAGHCPGSDDHKAKQREARRAQGGEGTAWPGEPARLSPQGRQRPPLRPLPWPAWLGPAWEVAEEAKTGLNSVSTSKPAEEGLCFRCPSGHAALPPPAMHTCPPVPPAQGF